MLRLKSIGVLGLLVFLQMRLFPAVRGGEGMYVGGTLAVPEKTEGKLNLDDEKAAKFVFKGGEIIIPYSGISSLEYGQKAGRRVGAALAVSPVLLFSKKRKHYLSMEYVDVSGTKQGAVFELSKGTYQTIISTMETRSGKKIEFESAEAEKQFRKGGK